MQRLRYFSLGLAAAVLVSAAFLGGYLLGDGKSRNSAAPAASGLGILWEARDLLETRFLGDIPDPREQAYGAIRGLIGSYEDPYTVFVEPAAREVEQDELQGHFGGIGAQLRRDDAGNVIVTVVKSRPADRAGVRDGDILLAVGQQSIASEMSIEEIVALIRGEVGTKVTLTLRRGEETTPIEVAIVREKIETPSVDWRVLDEADHTGYAKISIFSDSTADDLQRAIEELHARGVSKLVLDLRGNGGGLLDAAIETTSLFLGEGQVLREVRRGGQEKFYPTKGVKSPAQDWGIAVLVDSGTASASEILAGALRDQGRAVLIGEKTFGKGSVQEVHELSDGSSVHVTVARWMTPNRLPIDKTGLSPDVEVVISGDAQAAGRDTQLERAQAWLNGQR